MVRVWSRMLAVLLQQWIIVGTIWGDPTKSLSKAYEAVRDFAGPLGGAMNDAAGIGVRARIHRQNGCKDLAVEETVLQAWDI